jgi:preprotein translocase subunit SecD
MMHKLLLFAATVMLLSYSPVGAQITQESTPSLEFRLASDSATEGWKEMAVLNSEETLFVSNVVELHGGHIDKVSFFNDERGKPCVGLELTDEGGKTMEATTSRNLRKKLAIVLDGKVVSAPRIQSTITNNVEISGSFDSKDLLAFFQAIVLRTAP